MDGREARKSRECGSYWASERPEFQGGAEVQGDDEAQEIPGEAEA